MLQPGFYMVRSNVALTTLAHPGRARVWRGDWLVTNGMYIGRFDKDEYLDWLPLTWSDGKTVILDEDMSAQLEPRVRGVAFGQLEQVFAALIYVDDSAPTPPMPRPALQDGLGAYLRARRSGL